MRLTKLLKFLSGGFTTTVSASPTANRAIVLPDSSGTIALTSDITGGGSSSPAIVTVSASKTLALTDASSLQLCTNSSAITITVPDDATVNFPVGTSIRFAQDGAGLVTFSQSSTSINIRRSGSSLTTGHQTAGQYTRYTLEKVAANEWRLYRTTSMTITRSTFAFVGTDDSTLAAIGTSATITGSEVDVLGDNNSAGMVELYAVVTSTVAGTIDIKINNRPTTGTAYSKPFFEYSVATIVGTNRVPIGRIPAARFMNAEVKNNSATGTTSVSLLAGLEKYA